MRRLLILAAFAAVAIGTLTTGLPSASAASCSLVGFPAPYLGGGIHLDGTAGCTVPWYSSADTLQYESGGKWHAATSGGAPVPPQERGLFAAGQHGFSFDWGSIDQTPYCSFNWRLLASLRTSNQTVIENDTSDELSKSC